jgi:hypothetical protein
VAEKVEFYRNDKMLDISRNTFSIRRFFEEEKVGFDRVEVLSQEERGQIQSIQKFSEMLNF